MKNEAQEQIEIGRQAEEFRDYINEHPYFRELIDRIKVSIMQDIGKLSPAQTQDFTYLKTRLDAYGEIFNYIAGDIYLASEALKKESGEQEAGGLL